MKTRLSPLWLLSSFFLLSSCGQASYVATGTKDSLTSYATSETHFSSSDAGLDSFLNDYMARYLGYNEDLGNVLGGVSTEVGNGSTYEKMWEVEGLGWLNNASNVYTHNKALYLENYFRSITQDSYGLIYNSNQSFASSTGSPQNDGIPEGWPFPTAHNSYGTLETYEFNSAQEMPKGWLTNKGDSLTCDNGYATFSYKGEVNEEFSYGGGVSLADGVDADQAPMVEIDCRINDLLGYGSLTTIDDVVFRWQSKEDGDTWHAVRERDFATNPLPSSASYFASRMYLPMYLSPDWKGKHISAVQLAVVPKSGMALSIEGKINYIRFGYDTRKSTHTSLYLIALADYLGMSGNLSLLQDCYLKAQKAMEFLLSSLKGKDGLLDLSFFYAHDGVAGVGHGLPDGYWDILLSPRKNLESNIYFYKALLGMAKIERWAKESGLVSGLPSVKDGTDPLKKVSYDEDEASLLALASNVKTLMEKNVADGGFYNPDTGRFAAGVNDKNVLLDYGFVMWNLEALSAGIGNDAERSSIMNWISGSRIVEGDNSTGKDIYLYEFAPRITTKKNSSDYWWGWRGGNATFGKQIQDGGAAICWSYYDLLSRQKSYGNDNAFARLKEIEAWYQKVETAKGYGEYFYRDYYDNLPTTYDKDGNEISYSLQGGPSNGSLGLDYEFFESIMLYASVPLGFFGLTSGSFTETKFTYALPSSLSYWQIDNLQSLGVTYSLKMGGNAFVVGNAQGELSKEKKFTFSFKTSSSSFKVRINGSETSDYTFQDGVVSVSVPMSNVKVSLED
jgi:hypothetical protein